MPLKPKAIEWGTFYLLLTVYIIVCLISIMDYLWFQVVIFGHAVQILFFIILLFGLIMRFIIQKQLGKYYDANIKIWDDHKLINQGIYKYIRHPMYLSNIIIFLGIAGIFSSVLGIISVFIFIVPSLMARIFLEEKYLLQKFGNNYQLYIDETKRFLPGIW
ncbi:MAG: isoprenylcysteine carboxylmethyltransferase family protein [Patescibacteria group bacterium]